VSPSAGGDRRSPQARPRRRLGGRRAAAGPKQGCVPAAAAAEQVAAGWPPWLVAVAGEALRGWAPRRADTFEKLNKVYVPVGVPILLCNARNFVVMLLVY
jgi:cyclin-dependent kinase 12/13